MWLRCRENRFRPVELGSLGLFAIVLVSIGCVLSCPFQRYLTSVTVKYKEEKSMKAKMIKGSATVAADVLFVLQAVGTNLLATALLA